MKKLITFISDTHGRHKLMTNDLPGGDIIIHGGDVSNKGLLTEINDFLEWFKELPYTHKIFIAGNHDFGFENIRHNYEYGISIPDNVIYLFDNSVNIDGINIYGSPWQPRFYDWAFNLNRGYDIAQKWNIIPGNTDILITHGPAYSILDRTPSGMNAGCEDLYERINDIKPRIHICGHIHGGYGYRENNGILFINASSLDERYEYNHKPIVLEYDFDLNESVFL